MRTYVAQTIDRRNLSTTPRLTQRNRRPDPGLHHGSVFDYSTNMADLAAADQQRIIEVGRRHGATFLAIFGSTARGSRLPTSDVDLLARFSSPKSMLDLVRIEREISYSLGRDVDLVTEGAISPYLRARIEADMQVLYGSRS
jgi:uncharacterized protein